ncbi:interleukin-6 receptor subunit beta-like [Pituophis catenifer annectens]|uniref:interleukin-6 receptor subunit beta-like n=1 Tax=Pituophis catenifer annectens TaxID=94852 RepID=UPI0039957416
MQRSVSLKRALMLRKVKGKRKRGYSKVDVLNYSVSGCDYSLCKFQPDWQDDMTYYYEEISGVHLFWSPLSNISNPFAYTVFLKWAPNCCEKLEKVSSPINRTRRYMLKRFPVTIWVTANYSHESCVTTKNITIVPRKIEKCPSPFNVNTQQLFNKLIITWESPQNILQYELQYKEATQRTSSWIPVSMEMKAFNVTISGVNPAASYMVRLRCIPKNNRCSVCLWTEETSIPYKLTKKPTILKNITKEISPGKRSFFLTWETYESKHTIGYFIHIKRILDSFHGITYLNIKKTCLHLNLSMAAYDIKITAYNEHGNSSSMTYRVPDFVSTYSDLPGHLIISNWQNYTIITWNLKYNPDCLAIDWGTGIEDMKSKSLCQNETNVILEHLQPYQLYKVMLHALDRRSKDLMKDERTLAVADFYAVEGVPRIGPTNVTISAVTKRSAVVNWTEIPTKDCLGFLLGYRIHYTEVTDSISWAVTLNSSMKQHRLADLKANTHYTVHISGITRKGEGAQSQPQDFTTLKYDQGEFKGMVVGLCLGLIIIPAITIAICSSVLKRSRKFCWPPVPNPRDSSAMQVAERTFPVALLRPSLQPLLPSAPLNEADKLYVIKDDLEAFPPTSPATGRVSTEYSEAVVREKEVTLPKPHNRVNASEKAKAGLHLDYVGMEFSHKAMQKLSENLPMKKVHL